MSHEGTVRYFTNCWVAARHRLEGKVVIEITDAGNQLKREFEFEMDTGPRGKVSVKEHNVVIAETSPQMIQNPHISTFHLAAEYNHHRPSEKELAIMRYLFIGVQEAVRSHHGSAAGSQHILTGITPHELFTTKLQPRA